MFPIKTSYEKGLKGINKTKSSRDYVSYILDTYVGDTPFRQKDVYEIHQNLQEIKPSRTKYTKNALRKMMGRLRKEGAIEVLDDNPDTREDYLYVWMDALDVKRD